MDTTPMVMPIGTLMAPAESRLKTRPSAVTCAETPAQVAEHDDERTGDFDRAAEAFTVIVADRQQRHFVQLAGEEQAHQDQAGAGAEGVFDHSVQAAVHELGGDAQHGFRTEPGGERGGDDHHQRQVPPGDREIGGVLDAPGGIQADADRDQQVDNHQGQQHRSLLIAVI
jgi:hypothetical protein